jgi:hypothetical protein
MNFSGPTHVFPSNKEPTILMRALPLMRWDSSS